MSAIVEIHIVWRCMTCSFIVFCGRFLGQKQHGTLNHHICRNSAPCFQTSRALWKDENLQRLMELLKALPKSAEEKCFEDWKTRVAQVYCMWGGLLWWGQRKYWWINKYLSYEFRLLSFSARGISMTQANIFYDYLGVSFSGNYLFQLSCHWPLLSMSRSFPYIYRTDRTLVNYTLRTKLIFEKSSLIHLTSSGKYIVTSQNYYVLLDYPFYFLYS